MTDNTDTPHDAWKRGYNDGTTYGIAYQAGAHSALEDGAKHNPYPDTPRPLRALPLDEQTRVIRSIDAEFNSIGGTTRHWVQLLNDRGYQVALIDKENTMPDDTEFCDLCSGPFAESSLQEGYGGHWDTCPNGVAINEQQKAHAEPDDTILVPRALIERVYRVCGGSPAVQELHALLDPPKPPAPRLRVVSLDELANYDGGFADIAHELEDRPDVLTVLDEVVDGEPGRNHTTHLIDRHTLKARIRAALGVAE